MRGGRFPYGDETRSGEADRWRAAQGMSARQGENSRSEVEGDSPPARSAESGCARRIQSMTQTNHPSPGGDDLKPCPFCGSEMTREGRSFGWFGHRDRDGDCVLSRTGFSPADLAAWNQRAPTTGDSEELARAIEQLVTRSTSGLTNRYSDTHLGKWLRAKAPAILSALRSTPYGGEVE